MNKNLIRAAAVGVGIMLSCLAHAQLPGLTYVIPGDDVVAVAAADQVSPAVSAGGAARLAVWADERANPYPAYHEYETSFDIYGVRLDAAGAPLDAVPIAINAGRGSQTRPQVAWNGTHWLVVFRTSTLSGTGFYYQSSLAAVRVAADGTVLDADPIPLYGLGTGQFAVASDGAGWVVAAQGNDTSGDIVALRIDALGQVLDPPTVSLVPQDAYSGSGMRLAHAGGNYLLTYTTSTGTGAVLFDSFLAPLGAPYSLLDGASISALAGTAHGFYIAWNHQRPDFTLTILGSRVGLGGTLLDGQGVDLAGNASPFGNAVGAVWDGLNWRVGWLSSGVLHLARVNDLGQVLNPGGTATAATQVGPMAGTGSGGVQVVWSAFSDNEYDVFGATIDAADQTLAVGGISTGQPRQSRSDMAAGAAGYMLSYRSAVAGNVAVLAQPLGANGVATGLPVELDQGTTLNGPGSPAVAWNGQHYMVSWGTDAGIVAMRIAQDGTAVDSAPTLVMANGFGPAAIEAVGTDFLVVGRRFGSSAEYIFPIGARVSGTTGALLDAVPIELGATSQSGSPFTVFTREPAVTALNGQWLVAWHSNFTHDDPNAFSIGVFVDSAGQKGEPFLIAQLVTNGGNSINQIALASSGVNALFAQSQELTPNLNGNYVENDMELFLINPDTSVQYVGNVTPWLGNQYRPEISFDGQDYIVAYQDQINRLAPHSLAQLDARSDFYGMRVTPGGTIVDPQGFLIDDYPFGQTDVAIASLGANTLIGGSIMLNDGAASSYRVMLSDILDGSDRFPVAVAQASARSGDVPLSVQFGSTGSVDPEGGPISYSWQFGDGASSTAASPTHEFVQAGEFPVLLTVSDITGRTASQAIMVKVTEPNALPVAVASADRLSGPAPLSVVLSADGSYDPDGALGNIEWRLSDGRLYYGTPAFFTFNSDGTYTATLRVYDSRGAFSEDSLTIVVGGPNQPPVAQASATPTSGSAPLAVAFSSAGSGDSDGSIVSYAWDFGDGSSGGGANPTHSYVSIGTYTATLTVTDNSGAQASDDVLITVSGHSSAALLTSIDMSIGKFRGTPIVRGKVSVVNGIGEPEMSVSVQGVWTLPDNSRITRYEYSDAKGIADFSVPNSGDGTYTLEIVNATLAGSLFDPQGSETVDSITIGDPPDTTPPAQPTGLNAVAGNTQVSLDWADNGEGDLAGYHVERADAAGGPFSRLTGASPTAASQYLDTGLVNGVSYFYRVIAVDTSGNQSTASATVSAIPNGGGGTATSLHIGSITLGTVNAGKGRKHASASVSVIDNTGQPVPGATVSGQFSGSYSDAASADTGADGIASLLSGTTQKGGVSFGFCVDAIQHPGLTYEPTDNIETCDQF